jgi:SAM-dependent methyltransferase
VAIQGQAASDEGGQLKQQWKNPKDVSVPSGLPAIDMNKKLMARFFPATRVSGFSEVDGSILFYNLVNSRILEGGVVLDFGAGRGVAAEDPVSWRRGLAATSLVKVRRAAVDVDAAVLQNPLAGERLVMSLADGRVRIPMGDSSVDVIICDWVVEHLPKPADVFAEFRRVLRKGGTVCVRTSNKWHYAYLAARLLGESALGARALRRAQPGRKDEDVFPKLYRVNSARELRLAMAEAKLAELAVFTWDPEPAYVGESNVGGVVGFALHRLALLGVLPRAVLLGFAIKE